MIHRIREYISVVFAIFVRDFLRIVRNPVVAILLIGACALPSVYAWYCTAANWDPYQSTEGIRFAVANEDIGADDAETGKINVGEDVIEKLKGNHELGWAFYDNADKAINSVYSGESFAAIVIPKDFSESFVDMLDGKLDHPKLDYYLNEKISAAAPDFTNEGVDVVSDDIDQSFVKMVSDTVIDVVQDKGLVARDEASDAESKLESSVFKADSALQSTRDAIADSAPAIDDMMQACEDATTTLSSLDSSVPELETKLSDARSALGRARTAAAEYESKLVGALAKSAASLGASATEAQSALSSVAGDLSLACGETSAALAQTKSIANQNGAVLSGLDAAAATNPSLGSLVSDLRVANGDLKGTIASLEKASDAMQSTLEGIDGVLGSIDEQAQACAAAMSNASSQISDDVAPTINRALDDYADALGSASGVVLAMRPAIDQTRTSLEALAQALSQSSQLSKDADESLRAMQGRIFNLNVDAHALESSASVRALDELLETNPQATAEFIASPAKLETIDVYPVKNYGSGVVSFFTSIALWVAGFVFIDILKMRVDPVGLPSFTERQAYWGRLLLFMALGLLPPLIVCIGDLFLGIQCENPFAFILAGLVSGLVYVNIIYALANAFRYIGKGLAVLLLIVQIPGSSGLFPIEMMPDFYQVLHPLLPFAYTIDAFRQTIGGFYGMDYWHDLAVLVFAFIPLALIIGLVLGPRVSNLTMMLDKRIEDTGLFIGEYVDKDERVRKSRIVQAIMRIPDYRNRLEERAKRMKITFPLARRIGWIALGAQFVITFALMVIVQADTNTKLVLLLVMVVGIVLVDSYLISLVYLKASVEDVEGGSGDGTLIKEDAKCAHEKQLTCERGEGKKHDATGRTRRHPFLNHLKSVGRVCANGFLRLRGNIIAIVIMCGLVIMPSLYVWFSLLAFWNPENNTGNLDIAIVNEDSGYQSDLIPARVDAGAQVIDELYTNKKFHWEFLDRESALDGVRSGAYYAAIILPKDFSADLLSVFSDNMEQPTIEYYVNEKINPIAPHLTSIGASTLQDDIGQTFTTTITGIALEINTNLSRFMSGEGVASYAHTLASNLKESAEELDSDARQVDTFSLLLGQMQSLAKTSTSALNTTSSVAKKADPLASEANAGMQASTNGAEGLSKLAEEAVSDARSSFEAIRDSANAALNDMRDDPAALQAVIMSTKADLGSIENAYKAVRSVVQGSDPTSPLLSTISAIIAQIDTLENELGDASSDIASGADGVDAAKHRVSEALDRATSALDEAQSRYASELDAAAEQLVRDLSAASRKEQDISKQLARTADVLSGSSGPLTSSIDDVRDSLDQTSNLLAEAASSMHEAYDELTEALANGDLDRIREIVGNDPQSFASMIAAPTRIDKHAVYGVADYGSAMSPFYTSLGLFIGALFLAVVCRLRLTEERRRELGNPTPAEEYLGNFAFFLIIAFAQSLLMCSGNLFFLGVQCDNVALYYLSGLATSFVFLNIVYALVFSFDDIGRALAVILLVMQVAGSGGEMPIQLSAPLFQALYPWLPFTHSMALFQGAVAGIYGNQYLLSLLCLLAFVIPALLLGLVLRRPVAKINDAIEAQLEKTRLL